MAVQVCVHPCCLASQALTSSSDLFPPGLAEETLRTLATLFPSYDSKTRKWVLAESTSTQPIDNEVLECGCVRDRRVDQFKYWHKELIALQKIFDKPRQMTLAQSLHDRRDITRWYTFWIAVVVLVLTVFFGVTQTILSAMQVYKAYHPTLL